MKKRPVFSLPFLLGGLLTLPGLSLSWASSEKDKQQPRYTLLVGSVFTLDGFALPGVRVSIKRKTDRKPKWHGVSDRRGEFAVRLPPGGGTYEITTHSKEYANETRTVEFHGEERGELIFRLPRKTNSERRED